MNARQDAFTRLELLAIIIALLLVAMIAWPLRAGSKGTSQRAACYNNLRQIGFAAQSWADNYGDHVPWATFTTEGGTRPVTGFKAANAWAEFATLSNELVSPHVLACPNDSATRVASHWDSAFNGFLNSGFRGNALSYFISYHCQPELPRSVVSGDRDFRPSQPPPVSCARGVNNAAGIMLQPPNVVVWTNLVHVGAGHLLFTDGSVEYVASARLQRL